MSSVAARPDVTGTVEQVMSGELFSGLLLDDIDQRAGALEVVLGRLTQDDTRLVWVGNPLRSPLTIERFLIQIVGPEVDLREERGPADVARIIAKPVGQESRLLIVVQQPETINAETLHLLVQMGWYLGGEPVQVQFLFIGSTAFVVPRVAKPTTSAFAALAMPAPRRRDILPLLLLLFATTIGVLISIAPDYSAGMDQFTGESNPIVANSDRSKPLVAGVARPRAAMRSTRAGAASDRNPVVACP